MIDIYETEDLKDAAEADDIIDDAFELCRHYEDLFSKTIPGSDIYRINHAAGKETSCDEKTIELIKKGIYYGELSGGCFDISIGAVTQLWDFHAEDPELPDEEELKEAIKHVDYRKIVINGDKIRLEDPEMMLDPGGLAKGYIADCVSEFLRESGVTSAVISLGGNVVCIGQKVVDKEKTPFKIGIETPYSDMSEITDTLYLSDQTAVTSGVYERFFEKDGERYHHIIDPKTGYPVKTDLLSATIVAPEGKSCDSDALSTTCLMLGKEAAEKLMEDMPDCEGYFLPLK